MSTKQTEPLLTLIDAQAVLMKSDMTVYNYRTREKKPLPVVKKPMGAGGGRARVYLKPSALVKWAEAEGLDIDKKALAKAVKEAEKATSH